MSNRHKPVSRQVRDTQQALVALARHADRRKWSAGQQIEFLFSCATSKELYAQVEADSPLALRYRHWVKGRTVLEQRRTRQVLLTLADKRIALLNRPEVVPALGLIGKYYWSRQRELADWQPRTRNAYGQLESLVRHLFDGYGDVPGWVLEAWATGEMNCAGVNLAELTIHLGAGRSLRSFAGLPRTLTKKQEHEMRQAPAGCTFIEALRYGQLASRGALDWLGPVLQTEWSRTVGSDDDFWLGVVDFFAAASMVDPQHFGPVCDWIQQKRTVGIGDGPPQPGFSLKGRSMASVLLHTEQWHRLLARGPRHGGELLSTTWSPLLVSDFSSGEDQRVRITQLRTYEELVEEGRALHHCVASYLYSCQKGRCGIFSLKMDGARSITLEVLRNRTVVQARGRYNRSMLANERHWVTRWAAENQLSLSKHI
ncbi:PcfJ domain-containing protein [Hymenobacter cellulosivorans]|uniref:PcfJ domain-containing protein n=1 Tax=Hymenobacter cellulosivorans TaxID=2932249 RepID=A0ABY4F6V7_9BACT|nr:PcfJ domain-containing protein [Hymenobacter cellulosivorans]UOQ52273.1 PcfJ domain-containing protein [Hymenobacter cellulosivorans]